MAWIYEATSYYTRRVLKFADKFKSKPKHFTSKTHIRMRAADDLEKRLKEAMDTPIMADLPAKDLTAENMPIDQLDSHFEPTLRPRKD